MRARRGQLPVALSLSLVAAAAWAASPPRLQSGRYEELQLAVAPDGSIAGAYGEEEGTGVTRSCEFTLTGRLQPGGATALITVHSAGYPDHHGRLVATGDGVGLDVTNLGELPGSCETASLLGPGKLTPYGRTGAADWTWFATVTSARARFHSSATGDAGRGYLVKDEAVAIGRRQGARWQANYTSPSGHKTRGWIEAADLTPLPHG